MMKDFVLNSHLAHNVANLIAGAKDGIFEDILCYSKVVRDLVTHKILTYLREKGIFYPYPRRGRRTVHGEGKSFLHWMMWWHSLALRM